jgi:hypothetical protein
MALSGSLDDFNILNILQMIKLEGKTGRLTLSEHDDLVKITFDNGAIIYAEAAPAVDDARIRETLLSNGLMLPAEWREVEKEHEDRLRPYWELLSRRIDAKLIIELIRRQVIDNVYAALRWKTGEYEFAIMKNVKYNNKVMTPMDVDGLLMEGCRIADEWPRALKGAPPLTTFVVKNILGEEEDEEAVAKSAAPMGEQWGMSLEKDILDARGVQVTGPVAAVLSVVGSGKTIQEILYAARQGQFDSLDAIVRLLSMGILKVAERKREKVTASDGASSSGWLVAVALLAAVVAGGAYWQVATFPTTMAARLAAQGKVKVIEAGIGLRELERGLKIHALLKGTPPASLDDLVVARIVEKKEVVDPWDNPYRYTLKEGGFTLYSEGADRFLQEDNIYLPPPPSRDGVRKLLDAPVGGLDS